MDGVVIDDERLQELLAKASSLYNSGEYKGAIDAWKEALGVDPGSQKAQEGIRMATLLLGDFDSAPTAEPEQSPAEPADGVDPSASEGTPEEREARIELGVARVKQLIAERKYSDAIEGAQGLLPLDPESPEILRLLEEAQHAFESSPFIDEHLTLARELLKQERFSEAEAECKKIFALDATHPEGKALLKEIRDQIQINLKAAASQLGGMTVKLTMPQAIAAGVKLNSKGPVTTPAVPAPPQPPAPQAAARAPLAEDVDEAASAPGEELPALETGEAAAIQEDVASRAVLEAAFQDSGAGAAPAEESPFELAGEGTGAAAPSPEPALQEEVVEAKTIRPPTSRVVPRQAAAVEAKAPARPTGPIEPPPVVSTSAKKTEASTEPAPASRPAPGHPRTAPSQTAQSQHAPAAPPASVPVAEGGEDASAAWEAELTQLNLKDKERGLLRGTGAKATGKPTEAGEMDLMSLLDTGAMPGTADIVPGAPVAEPEAVPLSTPKEPSKPAGRAPAGRAQTRTGMVMESPVARDMPAKAERSRPSGRTRPPASAGRGGSMFMKLLFVLVVLLGGGAAYVYYMQPALMQRLLGAGGHSSQPVVPPAGAPSGSVDGGHGPIPTPIGGTSRQQTAPSQTGEAPPAAVGAAGAPPGNAVHPAAAQAQAATVASQAGGTQRPSDSQVAAVTGTAIPATARPSSDPIKPQTMPAMSKEEMVRKIAAYTADGRRLISLGKWREARAKLNAVLALDPANIEVKELADQAQAKIDDEQKLQDEFDSTKKLYSDKDYENALRKLYRLPRDKGLGDIDLYIRNSWYNWAVVLLKAGNSKDALAKLSEELAVDPDDAAALKLQEVAEKYTSRAKDRTYYAFTDGLVLRGIDQK
jgi:tetratricopeptide (TPR) repeat protein